MDWPVAGAVVSFSLGSHARSGVAEARRDGRKLAEISVKRAKGQEDRKSLMMVVVRGSRAIRSRTSNGEIKQTVIERVR